MVRGTRSRGGDIDERTSGWGHLVRTTRFGYDRRALERGPIGAPGSYRATRATAGPGRYLDDRGDEFVGARTGRCASGAVPRGANESVDGARSPDRSLPRSPDQLGRRVLEFAVPRPRRRVVATHHDELDGARQRHIRERRPVRRGGWRRLGDEAVEQ